ncbi:MerR family transcriptional regulator [Amycolatopsis anabasis]|uniref:MerR family transcriptional regulator n=1 Tax=Amycolatopsis anabasis TaxID=1840409 RepID=UPI00131E9CF9|nr:MerR family transcriptional regulator [Amycolatopsis anabasis]
MRMAELSRESGVPVATIKYYLREGLLPPGERTGPNQARYGREHVRRLGLVRALLDVAGMSIADTREVVAAIDEPETGMHHVLGSAQKRLTPRLVPVDEESRAWAVELIETVAAERGWRLEPEGPVVESLVAGLCALRDLGLTGPVERLGLYAELADRVAEVDFSSFTELSTVESMVELAVVGTVLTDSVTAALRRIAQKNASARFFGTTPDEKP